MTVPAPACHVAVCARGFHTKGDLWVSAWGIGESDDEGVVIYPGGGSLAAIHFSLHSANFVVDVSARAAAQVDVDV